SFSSSGFCLLAILAIISFPHFHSHCWFFFCRYLSWASGERVWNMTFSTDLNISSIVINMNNTVSIKICAAGYSMMAGLSPEVTKYSINPKMRKKISGILIHHGEVFFILNVLNGLLLWFQ